MSQPRRNPRRGDKSDEGSNSGGSGKRVAGDDSPSNKDDLKKIKTDAVDGASEAEMPATALTGLVLELSALKTSLQSFTSTLPGSETKKKPPQPAVKPPGPWGWLTRQTGDGAGVSISLLQPQVSIGRSSRCTIVVDDAQVPAILARLRAADEGSGVTVECLAGTMCLNDVPLRKLARTPLKRNDHLTFLGNDTHGFAFSDVMLEAEVPRVLAFEEEAGATAAGNKKRLRSPSAGGDEEGAAPSEPKASKLTPAPAPSPAVATPASQSKASAAAVSSAEERASKLSKLKTSIEELVTRPEDNVASFEEFPYHLAESTKHMLLDSVAVFLNRPSLIPYTKNLTDKLSPRLMVEGPFGTELYQVELVKALAKQHNVSMLLVDSPHAILVPDPKHSAALADDDLPPSLSGRDSVLSGLLRSKFGGSSSSATGSSSASLKKMRFRKGDRVRFLGTDDGPEADGPSSLRGPPPGLTGEVVLTFEEDSRSTVGVAFDVAIPGGVSFGGACDEGMGYFVNVTALRPESEDYSVHELEGLCIDAIMAIAAKHAPIIVCIRDIEGVAFASYTRYKKFQRAFEGLPPRVVVVGLRAADEKSKASDRSGPSHRSASSLMDLSFLDHIRPSRGGLSDEPLQNERAFKMLTKLLPVRVAIAAPQRNPELAAWKKAMEEDIKMVKLRNNRAQLERLLKKCNIEMNVEAISAPLLQQEMFSVASMEQSLGWALGHHAYSAAEEEAAAAGDADAGDADAVPKLKLSVASFEHALKVRQSVEDSATSANPLRNIVTENEFEKKILADVVPADELNVTFDQIGALDKVKETLRELVMLPLTRPELFRKGNLMKPTKGVLLFGPPGTGKTMLAKAVATECKANFLNVSMASIGSKWFGEGEKFAQAVFTLASKISPTVIFFDEIDSILGKRDRSSEHEAMRKIKNTIMSMWDGLKTQDNERVIVLGASNRPFDLDEAVLRRLPRRMLVDLPDEEQRVQILKVICAKEDLEPNFDFAEVAKNTEGYSGSDLKNLCVAAAYIPIREILEAERARGLDPHAPSANGPPQEVQLRPLMLKDFLAAKDQVSSSVSEVAASVSELRDWNATYGEGGSRETKQLSYYM